MGIFYFIFLKNSVLLFFCFCLFVCFDVGHLKSLIDFVTIVLLFYVLIFWLQGIWDLSSPARDQTPSPALEEEFLTTGPPGKFQEWEYFRKHPCSVFNTVTDNSLVLYCPSCTPVEGSGKKSCKWTIFVRQERWQKVSQCRGWKAL